MLVERFNFKMDLALDRSRCGDEVQGVRVAGMTADSDMRRH